VFGCFFYGLLGVVFGGRFALLSKVFIMVALLTHRGFKSGAGFFNR